MASSPWGTIDNVTKYERGISFVSTPGHGGLRVSVTYAHAKLTEHARKRAIKQGSYLFFEEDCDFCIAMFELPHLWPKIWPNKTAEEVRKDLFSSLSNWNCDYLINRGINPTPEGYAAWHNRKVQEEMHRNRHPDLIVAACSTKDPDVTIVHTADGKQHEVQSSSYKVRKPLNLLSECMLIKSL